MNTWSKTIGSNLKRIWKHPLYWLLIGVFTLMFTSEVLPEITRYGGKGNDDIFYGFKNTSESEQYKKEEIALKASLEQGSIIYNRYLMFFYFGQKEVSIPEDIKEEIKALLYQIQEKTISLEKYEKRIEEIKNKIHPKRKLLFLYKNVYGLKTFDDIQTYEEFIEASSKTTEKVRFSHFVGGYFADIMGISIGMYLIFFIAFVKPYSMKEDFHYLFALGISLLVVFVVLGGIGAKIGQNIAAIHLWGYQFQDMVLPFVLLVIPTLIYGLIGNYFITKLIKNGFIAIGIQLLYIFFTHSMDQISYFNYVIRWNYNIYTDYLEDFMAQMPQILINRTIFLGVSILLICSIKRWKRI